MLSVPVVCFLVQPGCACVGRRSVRKSWQLVAIIQELRRLSAQGVILSTGVLPTAHCASARRLLSDGIADEAKLPRLRLESTMIVRWQVRPLGARPVEFSDYHDIRRD
jgi:hypothetical protein